MNLINFIKKEFENFGKYERILFPLVIILIVIISLILKDNKIALLSAVCGVSYTILAGKGKISCYFIGITGTFCYCYLAFINGFYGNLMLYSLYYFPMEIIGIFKWKKHFKKEKQEIKKTRLSNKERIIYFVIGTILTLIVSLILRMTGDSKPVLDAFTTIFSIFAQLLTVKRCIEQWYIWFFVNLFSLIMWISAYVNGSNCFATVLMWLIYTFLAIYFLYTWQKEIKNIK